MADPAGRRPVSADLMRLCGNSGRGGRPVLRPPTKSRIGTAFCIARTTWHPDGATPP